MGHRDTVAGFAIALWCAGVAVAAEKQKSQEDQALLDQDRRAYEALGKRREQIISDIKLSYREVESGLPGGPDLASRLAALEAREEALADKEALLCSIFERGRELRRSIARQQLVTVKTGAADAEGLPREMAGNFRLSFEGATGDGTLSVVQTGALLSGSYDIPGMSRGTFFGNGGYAKLVLTLIDEQGDLFAVLRGSITGEGACSGTFLRTELSSGKPATGSWSALRKGSRAPGP